MIDVQERLKALAELLESSLQRQMSKGSNCITLCAEEVDAVIGALKLGEEKIAELTGEYGEAWRHD